MKRFAWTIFVTFLCASVWAQDAQKHLWTAHVGGPANDDVSHVAVDNQGNVVVTGICSRGANLGAGTVDALTNDVYVAKYKSDGTLDWSKVFKGTQGVGTGVAVDAQNNIVLLGVFWKTLDVGSQIYSANDIQTSFAIKLSPTGAILWHKVFDPKMVFTSVVTDAQGNLYAIGLFSGTAVLGSTLQSAGGTDVFFAKFLPNGDPVWSRRIGGSDYDAGASIALDPLGDIVVCGTVGDTVDFGNGPTYGARGFDLFVAKYSSDGQTLRWANRFGSDGTLEWARRVAVDSQGNINLVGEFEVTINFGRGTLFSDGLWDCFVAQFAPNGECRWSNRIGGRGWDQVRGVAVDGSNNVIVTGNFKDTVDFGDAVRTSTSGFGTAFLVKYAQNGSVIRSSIPATGDGISEGTDVAIDALGNILWVGVFSTTVNFGGPTFSTTWALDFDGFIVKYKP